MPKSNNRYRATKQNALHHTFLLTAYSKELRDLSSRLDKAVQEYYAMYKALSDALRQCEGKRKVYNGNTATSKLARRQGNSGIFTATSRTNSQQSRKRSSSPPRKKKSKGMLRYLNGPSSSR